MLPKIRHLLVPAAAIALLSGCGTEAQNFCPAVTSLVETASGSVFTPGSTADPSNLLYTVEIAGLSSSCDTDKTGTTSQTSVDIQFRATRAPSGSAAHYTIPYFVAIIQSDRILAKRTYTVSFDFEPGQTETKFSASVGPASITADETKKTFDYQILVGLQLSKGQLDYNRKYGHLSS